MAKEKEWNYIYSTQTKVVIEGKKHTPQNKTKNNGTNSTIVYVNPAI